MVMARKNSKLLLMGLDNAGKTSILLSLQKNTNLMDYLNLNPTKSIKQTNLHKLDENLNIWDFGGQEDYRKEYLQDLGKYTIGAEKFIYVIDLQDTDRYDVALDYLKIILTILAKENKGIEISIFIHKYDPDIQLNTKSEYNMKYIPELKRKIAEIMPSGLFYEIFKTSIYTVFQKIHE